MKKITVFIVSLLIISLNSTFAYTEKFKFMIDTMGVPETNVNGKNINEEIYDAYYLFVYGSPLDGYVGQRFKEVEEGLWTKNSGIWNNAGTRGKYWILGENKDGYEVHNHKFPVDIEPPTPPTAWRYAVLNDAVDSWQDQSKYMDEEQKNYMLNTKLMRNDITYDITANDIGLDKIRLENYATWKTKGTLYTQRYDMQNKRWAANFMVPPMAGDAELNSFAEFPNGTDYTVNTDEELNIPINFGAETINLTEFAKKEHVKQIKSELYINNNLISSVDTSGELKVEGSINYLVNGVKTDEVYILNIRVKSSLLTKFTTDGALVDIKDYVITINGKQEESGEELELEEYEEEPIEVKYVREEDYANFKEFPPPYVEDVEVKVSKSGKDNDLLKTRYGGNEFVCAGQTITIKATVVNAPANVTLQFQGDKSITTFDDLTKKFEWDEPRARKVSTFYGSLQGFKSMYQGVVPLKEGDTYDNRTEYKITYIIPYGTKQTLNSWATLRQNSKDAFNIDESKLFSRIAAPYQIVIKAKNALGADTFRVNLDVFERWDTIYNRDISKYTS